MVVCMAVNGKPKDAAGFYVNIAAGAYEKRGEMNNERNETDVQNSRRDR